MNKIHPNGLTVANSFVFIMCVIYLIIFIPNGSLVTPGIIAGLISLAGIIFNLKKTSMAWGIAGIIAGVCLAAFFIFLYWAVTMF
jgi:hypothetical protein